MLCHTHLKTVALFMIEEYNTKQVWEPGDLAGG